MRIMAKTTVQFFHKELQTNSIAGGKIKKIEKQAKKIVFKWRFLTFVVSHRLGLHGEGSHYQTHVDFCLQTGYVVVCEFVRACVRASESKRRQVLGWSASEVGLRDT